MDERQAMNCEQYREAIAADPSEAFDGGAAHASACVSCAEFRTEMQALDRRIAAALLLDVPELSLPELPHITDEEEARVVSFPFHMRSAPAWLAIAASFALVAVIATQYFSGGATYPSLGDEILAHLDHEPQSLRLNSESVSERRLDKVVRSKVANVEDGLGLITYARSCVINGNTIPHLVIQGKHGPVTLLLMPNEMIDASIPLLGKGVHGVIIPLGQGSIAIIGEREERIGEIEQRVVDSVTWNI